MTKPKAGVWHKEMYLERIAHLEQKYVKDCNIWLKSEQALTDRITQFEKERDKAESILNCATHTFKHKLKTCCVEAEILQLESQLKTAREEAMTIIETDLCTPCRWKIDKRLSK